jgi:hypothetical protein
MLSILFPWNYEVPYAVNVMAFCLVACGCVCVAYIACAAIRRVMR